jgi:hypothetical protein
VTAADRARALADLRDGLATVEVVADELARHQGLRGPMDDSRPDVWQNRCECGWDDGDERPGWKRRYQEHVAAGVLATLGGTS